MQGSMASEMPDLMSLLSRTDFVYPGWDITVARQKSFYVTGAVWFAQNVLSEVTKISFYEAEFYELLEKRKSWKTLSFDFDERFAARQAIDALSIKKKRPLRFVKAAQTILLCEAVLAEQARVYGVTATVEDLYHHMRIEPAVYFLEGYDIELHRRILKNSPEIKPLALRSCGQRFMEVFEDMARGYTVTYGLAARFRDVVLQFAEQEVGEVVPEIYARSYGATNQEAIQMDLL
jgi:hypothetical protein